MASANLNTILDEISASSVRELACGCVLAAALNPCNSCAESSMTVRLLTHPQFGYGPAPEQGAAFMTWITKIAQNDDVWPKVRLICKEMHWHPIFASEVLPTLAGLADMIRQQGHGAGHGPGAGAGGGGQSAASNAAGHEKAQYALYPPPPGLASPSHSSSSASSKPAPPGLAAGSTHGAGAHSLATGQREARTHATGGASATPTKDGGSDSAKKPSRELLKLKSRLNVFNVDLDLGSRPRHSLTGGASDTGAGAGAGAGADVKAKKGVDGSSSTRLSMAELDADVSARYPARKRMRTEDGSAAATQPSGKQGRGGAAGGSASLATKGQSGGRRRTGEGGSSSEDSDEDSSGDEDSDDDEDEQESEADQDQQGAGVKADGRGRWPRGSKGTVRGTGRGMKRKLGQGGVRRTSAHGRATASNDSDDETPGRGEEEEECGEEDELDPGHVGPVPGYTHTTLHKHLNLTTKCTFCSKRCDTPRAMQKHCEIYHWNMRVRCPQASCDAYYSAFAGIVSHLKEVHGMADEEAVTAANDKAPYGYVWCDPLRQDGKGTPGWRSRFERTFHKSSTDKRRKAMVKQAGSKSKDGRGAGAGAGPGAGGGASQAGPSPTAEPGYVPSCGTCKSIAGSRKWPTELPDHIGRMHLGRKYLCPHCPASMPALYSTKTLGKHTTAQARSCLNHHMQSHGVTWSTLADAKQAVEEGFVQVVYTRADPSTGKATPGWEDWLSCTSRPGQGAGEDAMVEDPNDHQGEGEGEGEGWGGEEEEDDEAGTGTEEEEEEEEDDDEEEDDAEEQPEGEEEEEEELLQAVGGDAEADGDDAESMADHQQEASQSTTADTPSRPTHRAGARAGAGAGLAEDAEPDARGPGTGVGAASINSRPGGVGKGADTFTGAAEAGASEGQVGDGWSAPEPLVSVSGLASTAGAASTTGAAIPGASSGSAHRATPGNGSIRASGGGGERAEEWRRQLREGVAEL